MKKWLLGLPLVLISVFIWLPLWMLISGTFMGGAELSENLAPIVIRRSHSDTPKLEVLVPCIPSIPV